MSQAYNKSPSELYGVEGAAGFCLDNGIFLFAQWVEGEMDAASSSAQNEAFARSNRARAFARCMGDDMETSTVGYADPFATGALIKSESESDQYPDRKRRKAILREEEPGDEIIDPLDLI